MKFEQEPLSNFRRDLAAEGEFLLRLDLAVRKILRRERIMLAWIERRIRRATSDASDPTPDGTTPGPRGSTSLVTTRSTSCSRSSACSSSACSCHPAAGSSTPWASR